MDFERFLDFNAFITDPKGAVEKAKELMKKEIEAEKNQLQLKVKQQQQEDYRKALNELKQQYEEMRQEAGINKLEEQLSDWGDVKFEPIEGLPDPEEINTNKTENEIEQIKETAKENAPKSGHDAYELMKNFYDSDVDSAIKDKVRFLPSDEALVYVEMLNEGLTPEEIEEKGFKEIKPENKEETEVQQSEETQNNGFWGKL